MQSQDPETAVCFINRWNTQRIGRVEDGGEPTSALLNYCNRKFLRPYMRILSIVGLSPISTDTTTIRTCISLLQASLVMALLVFCYIMQYGCLYRGDSGFPTVHKDSTTVGELLFGYILPFTLHMLGFVAAVIVCKIVDHEQLQNLIERVFLMSQESRQLCKMLWTYLACCLGLLCLVLTHLFLAVLTQTQYVHIKWLGAMLKYSQPMIKVVLLASISLEHIVEVIVLSSYCIECYLLRTHLMTLSHKLIMHSIESRDWMREMLEFHKLLDHLNQRVALPVSFYIVMNLAYAFSGLIYIFTDLDFHYSALRLVVLNITNVLLWLFMGLLPFFMAASITRLCQTAQANGHHIRVRPFVYHNTTNEDLNSMLLFASSLNMSAKLFRMPIQLNYLCFASMAISIAILTFGMCFKL